MILFYDGFDDISNQDTLVKKGYTLSSSGVTVTTVGAAQTKYMTGRALHFVPDDVPEFNTITSRSFLGLTSNQTHILGFAMKQNEDTTGQVIGYKGGFVIAKDSTTIYIQLESNNTFKIVFSDVSIPTATITLQDDIIIPNQWDYYEFRFICRGPSTPADVSLRKNNTTVYTNTTNVFIQNGVPSTVFQIEMVGPSQDETVDYYIDDVYFKDGIDGFVGACRVVTLIPNADSTVQFIPRHTNPNYQEVDETFPDNATYVSSDTNGAKDLYELPDMPAVEAVVCVQQITYAKTTTTSEPTVKNIIKDETGTETETTAAVQSTKPLTTSYKAYTTIKQKHPTTGVDWETSDIDDSCIGFVVTNILPVSPPTSETAADVSQVQIEVLGVS